MPMLKKDECKDILNEIAKMFPNAGCELNYNNVFELLVAVVLSAQTTDKAVNLVTGELFKQYPTPQDLSAANYDDVKKIIARIGLSTTKSKNIIALSKVLVEEYFGQVPNEFEKLIDLPGVGRKTANVVLSEGFGISRIAVDTHVERVSKRLGICEKNKNVIDVEMKLCELIEKDNWHKAHHLLLFFGRYFCKAKNPMCEQCFYKDRCCKDKI